MKKLQDMELDTTTNRSLALNTKGINAQLDILIPQVISLLPSGDLKKGLKKFQSHRARGKRVAYRMAPGIAISNVYHSIKSLLAGMDQEEVTKQEMCRNMGKLYDYSTSHLDENLKDFQQEKETTELLSHWSEGDLLSSAERQVLCDLYELMVGVMAFSQAIFEVFIDHQDKEGYEEFMYLFYENDLRTALEYAKQKAIQYEPVESELNEENNPFQLTM